MPCHFVAGLEHGVVDFGLIALFKIALGLCAGVAALFVLFAHQRGGVGIALAGEMDLQGLLRTLLRGGAGGLLLGGEGAGGEREGEQSGRGDFGKHSKLLC